jgi:hypothetical protein
MAVMTEGTVATAQFVKTISRAEETFSTLSAEMAIASEIILEARSQIDDAARTDSEYDQQEMVLDICHDHIERARETFASDQCTVINGEYIIDHVFNRLGLS